MRLAFPRLICCMMRSSQTSEIIVVCTRNRPSHLRTTLKSVAQATDSVPRTLLVIDASDDPQHEYNRKTIRDVGDESWSHDRYDDVPSLARQRNYALDQLPETVDIVHFIDDDVTVDPAYFDALSNVFSNHPDVVGAGGTISEPENHPSSPLRETVRRLFLLSHTEPGRVLASGSTTHAQHCIPDEQRGLRETEWLSGCSCSYRRAVLDATRFDERLVGYSMLEDLDLSYRISRDAPLVVQPRAQLFHRRSSLNRPDVEQYSRALTVHRRWFVEKHFDSVRSRGAYWWSVLGRLLAVSLSRRPHRTAALRGLLRGIRTVWTRNDSLLRTS